MVVFLPSPEQLSALAVGVLGVLAIIFRKSKCFVHHVDAERVDWGFRSPMSRRRHPHLRLHHHQTVVNWSLYITLRNQTTN